MKTSLLLNISTSREDGVLTGSLWLLLRTLLSGGSDKRGTQSSGIGGQHSRSDVSSSRTKVPSLSWLICILLCIHLHATFWKGPTFFSSCLSPIFGVSVFSLNTPSLSKEDPFSRIAESTRRH